ncbi:lethal (2) giant discs 1 isoform X3 [Haemaphysalis longicornis]
MARRSGASKARAGGAAGSLAQLGLFDMPDLDAIGNDDDASDDDADEGDLEAELSALLSGRVQAKPKKPKPKPASDLASIQMMAAAALKDVDSGAESDDANLSDDPELVAELGNLGGVHHEEEPAPQPPPRAAPKPPGAVQVLPTSPAPAASPAVSPSGEPSLTDTLQERLRSYTAAEAAAKSFGDSSKARRYGRAVKTLESLLKKAKAGAPVSEEEIPPPVAMPKPPAAASEASQPPAGDASDQPAPSVAPAVPARRPAPPVPSRQDSAPTAAPSPQEQVLATRRDQYKKAAINAKKRGDQQTAINYIRTAKQFDAVITALAQGQTVDLSKMPPPPPEFQGGSPPSTAAPAASPSVPTAEASKQTAADTGPMPSYIDENVEDDPSLFGGPPPPATIMEALQQRLDKYKSTFNEAKEQGNDRKARRLDRIVKQYEDAIKLYKAGKPVDFEELPAPPGFGPIPVPSEPAPAPKPEPPKPAAKPAPKPAPKPPAKPGAPQPGAAKPAGGSGSPKKPLRRGLSTTIDKQMQFLQERQRLFREAALEAKRRGDVEQAKAYLRTMKGIDPMIQATECGLPIDAQSIPIPPQLQEDFVVVEASECEPEGEGDDEGVQEMYQTLERELVAQHELCIQNKDHFFKLGDVASGTKFEKLAHDTNRDLLVVRNLKQRRDPLPRFHYETRVFSIVRCNHDLTDSDIEVSVVRAVNLPGRKVTVQSALACGCARKADDLDSYVIVTFPFPNDAPQSARTRTVKDTTNPEFNETFRFEVNRKSRSLARVMKRHPIKCEVWAKRGFLRSDASLGTASIKFEDLESKCELHDSYDVFDSKRPSGGKLEVKVRVREPFVSKQVEEIKHRWLIIGS